MTQYMSDFQRKFINRWSYLHCKLDGMNILPYLAISCLEMLHFLFVQGLHGKCLNMPRAQGPVWLFEICTGSKVGIPWNTNVPVRSSKYYINCQYNCKLHWGCYAVLTMLSSYQCYTVQILADIYCDILWLPRIFGHVQTDTVDAYLLPAGSIPNMSTSHCTLSECISLYPNANTSVPSDEIYHYYYKLAFAGGKVPRSTMHFD
jgi:hypothetical protein